MLKEAMPPMAAYQCGRFQYALPLLYRALQSGYQPFGVLWAVSKPSQFDLAQPLVRYVDRPRQLREGDAAGEADGSEGGYNVHLLSCFKGKEKHARIGVFINYRAAKTIYLRLKRLPY